MNNQTAVEWLQKQMEISFGDELKSLRGFFVIAKEMEKDQIEVAYDNGWVNALKYDLAIEWGDEHIDLITPEKYYNEQYGK